MRRIRACMRHGCALTTGLAAILLALLCAPVTIGAASTLDQAFLPTPANRDGLFGVSGGGGQMTGQTFTAGITGTLSQVDLYIAFITATTPHGSAPLTVQIQTVTRDGAPSGEVLGSATVRASQVPLDPNPGWVAVPITARSVAGKQYAIVLSTPDPLTDYAIYRTTEPVGFTPYAGGKLWFFTPTIGGWFTEPVLYDSFFRTYVTASPTITASASPSTIWPPNHTDVPVTVTVQVTAGGASLNTPAFILTSVQVTGGSASDIIGFTVGRPSVSGTVKANKDATYTLTYMATDQAGNRATATVTIVVQHDQGKGGSNSEAAPSLSSPGGTTSGAGGRLTMPHAASAPAPPGR